jgi:site-specific DNA-methyltransferase (adenine-specific)
MHKIFFGDSRSMSTIEDESVQLIITSPPYWQLKDYGTQNQIGFDDSYEEYIAGLNQVWSECFRVLSPGCRMCVNIGDQFARAAHYGRYKVIPIRERIVNFCESLGLDYMGAVIWQKATTMNTSGGGAVMGSFPHPRNGILKIDYEFILIFKKLGKAPKVSAEQKAASAMTTQEWNTYFAGHWNFAGEKQGDGHIAMFPTELPRRLIKMFSFSGEKVLDPFCGSGTTIRAAMELGRVGIGYEINPDFESVICKRLGISQNGLFGHDVEFAKALVDASTPAVVASAPKNGLQRKVNPKEFRFGSVLEAADLEKPKAKNLRVREIVSPTQLRLGDGGAVDLLGISILPEKQNAAMNYLKDLVLNKPVILKFSGEKHTENGALQAYVYLQNKTFVNAKLIKAGLVQVDPNAEHFYAKRFQEYPDHV